MITTPGMTAHITNRRRTGFHPREAPAMAARKVGRKIRVNSNRMDREGPTGMRIRHTIEITIQRATPMPIHQFFRLLMESGDS